MLQAEHQLLHRHAALAQDTGVVAQDQARQQAQDQMAIPEFAVARYTDQ